MKKMYSVLLALATAPLFAISQTTTVPMTPAPKSCNSNACLTNANIDVCPPGNSTVVTNHQNGFYHRGNSSNNRGANAVWRFRNIATVDGTTINCEVRIDQVYRATLHSIDDDGAVDQANASIRSFFAPRISPDQTLVNNNRNGFVQFTMAFFRNTTGTNTNGNNNDDFAVSVSLARINYVHYDIDGNDAQNVDRGTEGSWFRETGNALRISPASPLVLANSQTDLSRFDYEDRGNTWTGFAGTTCERDGVSRCAQVASSFSYEGVMSSITFRMGYDYNAGGNIGTPIRQYGSRLGCFNFPSQSTLPVRLLSFNASYRNQQTLLSWTSEAEVAFEKYVVERSADGTNYTAVGQRAASGSTARVDYSFTDDLSNESGSQYFYRLRMVDIDGTFKFSSVLLVKREHKNIAALSISPNPVRAGQHTIRFSAHGNSNADMRVVDLSGRTILQQQQKVFPGNNSITINGMEKLQPGTYVLQISNDGEVSVVKFTVVR